MLHALRILEECIRIQEWKDINQEDKNILKKLKEFLQKKKIVTNDQSAN